MNEASLAPTAAENTSMSVFPPELFREVFAGPDPYFQPSRHSGHGHRAYVGGDAGSGLPFRDAAKFQLDFLVQHGLRRDTVLLDIGCGCLRGGIHFIHFLDPGKYLGMDISAEIVRRGIVDELGMSTFLEKRPEFVISDQYDVGVFSQPPVIALANSVFTHVGPKDIRACLSKLAAPVTLFATFNEGDEAILHSDGGHYLGGEHLITYTRDEMHAFGRDEGFETEYLGNWGHPKNSWVRGFRHQMMFRFWKRAG